VFLPVRWPAPGPSNGLPGRLPPRMESSPSSRAVASLRPRHWWRCSRRPHALEKGLETPSQMPNDPPPLAPEFADALRVDAVIDRRAFISSLALGPSRCSRTASAQPVRKVARIDPRFLHAGVRHEGPEPRAPGQRAL
jgi:hypothetical protein